jgi:hypothetical protein
MQQGRWAAVARLGQLHWMFGNVYEAVVDVPALLADAHPKREPGVLTAGSPLRYYLPAAPVTFVATGVALVEDWRSGGDRRLTAAAAAGTASAAALTAYLVRTVNLRLLKSPAPLTATERRALITRWHRGNLVRLVGLTVAAWAVRRRPSHASVERSG